MKMCNNYKYLFYIFNILTVNILFNFHCNLANDDYTYDDYDSDYNSTDYESDFNNITLNTSSTIVNTSIVLNTNISNEHVLSENILTSHINEPNISFNESNNDLESDNEYNDNDFEEDKSSSVIEKFFDSLTNDEEGGDYKFDNKSQVLDSNAESVLEKLLTLYENLVNNIKPINQQFSQRLSELLYSSDLSPQCLAAFARINHAINRKKLWAFKFIDSIGKLPSGLAEGVSSSFGEYDECLDIKSDSSENDDNIFYGQYCLAKPIIPPNVLNTLVFNYNSINLTHKLSDEAKDLTNFWEQNINKIKLILAFNSANFSLFRLGVCIPSTCSPIEVQNAFNKILHPITRIPIEIGPECDVRYQSQSQSLDNFQLTAISIFIFLIILVMMSTIYEIYYKSSCAKQKYQYLKTSFSIISNTKKLFDSNNRISSADTILLTFIIWTFIARSYLSPLSIGTIGLKRVFNSLPNHLMTDKRYFWVRTPFPNETLIIISAFIVSYDFFGRKFIGYSVINYIRYIFEKWLRLSRRIVGPILVVYILSIFGSGPLWNSLKPIFVNPCKTNYIQSLLLFNNYFEDFDQMCNSSYLSAIFQLQIIAPLFMIPFIVPVFGYIFNIYMIIMGCLVCISPKLLFGINISPFEISTMNSFPEIKHSIIRFTQYTDQYISSFAMGILLGYLVRKKPNLNIGGKFFEIILWIVCPLLSLTSVIWAESFVHLNELYSDFMSKNQLNLILCVSCGKILWSLGVCWTVYACSTGRGGIINRLLSFKIFTPLSRLSIGILVLHSIIINYRIYTRKETYVMTHSLMIECIIIDLFITIFLAYILHILIECPIYNLIKLIINSDSNCAEKYGMICMHRNALIKKKKQEDNEFKFIFPVD